MILLIIALIFGHKVQARVSLLPPKPIAATAVGADAPAARSLEDSKTHRQPPSAPAHNPPAPAGSSRLRASGTYVPMGAPAPGNLPSHLRVLAPSQDSPIILPAENPGLKLAEISTGDLLIATIPEGLLAYQGSKSPVRALITKGPLKGGALTGEATLEKNSKRIVITFKNLRPPKDQDIYELQAHAVDYQGLLGVKGDYHSDEPWFFAGEFLAAGAAGLMESQVEREQNQYGNFVQHPGIENATKKAGATAASRTADHFSEKIKSAPEYSTLAGPIQIRVLVMSPAKLTK